MINEILNLVDRYPDFFGMTLAIGYALGALCSFIFSLILSRGPQRNR